jgi:hypothetical protein
MKAPLKPKPKKIKKKRGIIKLPTILDQDLKNLFISLNQRM